MMNSHSKVSNNTFDKSHTNRIYYSPRAAESNFESNLAANKFKFYQKKFEDKYQKKQLPDQWMTEVTHDKSHLLTETFMSSP